MVILKNADTSKDVAHIVKITNIYEKETEIIAPPELEALAKKLDGMADPTSDEALSLIFNECQEYLLKIGYDDDKFRDRRNVVYSKNESSAVACREKIDISGLENLTTIDVCENDIAFSVFGGKIVSVAAAIPKDGGICEICVETAIGYRGRGLASENVAALSDDLIRKGSSVRYLCAEKNERSKRVAKNAGFFEIGRSYDYIVRRKEG